MKMESTRKLSKVNFQWTETVYQNNNNNNNNNNNSNNNNNNNNITEFCILFYIFQGLKM